MLPPIGVQEDYKEYIQTNYDMISPELFGLHYNADIATNQNKSEKLLNCILGIQPQTVTKNKNKSPEDLLEEKADFVLERLPMTFDLEMLDKR
mmetsp:Transcript_22465/g.50132  ORF Transcript_22465/g.50132 Transcript_22465/m.50132 type:complete len:93 (+) Transcript_22465:1399-1677(+)